MKENVMSTMSQVSEQQVLAALRAVNDPDLGRDIVSLGFVKDLRIQDGSVGASRWR
jgi:ATP-binding protein involved in chromosome partitioning